jgi:prolyl-tRNA synthetase
LPWSTAWGSSTRLIGGLIMTHGDDAGLILPPRVAPYQVVIVPIPPRRGDWNEDVLPKAREIAALLRSQGVRVHLDDRETQQPGFKYADWEMRGVPLRLELGPKDLEKKQCVLVRRDTREKAFVPEEGLGQKVLALLDEIQQALRTRARGFLESHTTAVSSYEEFKAVMAEKRGFLLAAWCGDAACEAKIKEETKATIRVMPFGDRKASACVRCGRPSPADVYFAQAY